MSAWVHCGPAADRPYLQQECDRVFEVEDVRCVEVVGVVDVALRGGGHDQVPIACVGSEQGQRILSFMKGNTTFVPGWPEHPTT